MGSLTIFIFVFMILHVILFIHPSNQKPQPSYDNSYYDASPLNFDNSEEPNDSQSSEEQATGKTENEHYYQKRFTRNASKDEASEGNDRDEEIRIAKRGILDFFVTLEDAIGNKKYKRSIEQADNDDENEEIIQRNSDISNNQKRDTSDNYQKSYFTYIDVALPHTYFRYKRESTPEEAASNNNASLAEDSMIDNYNGTIPIIQIQSTDKKTEINVAYSNSSDPLKLKENFPVNDILSSIKTKRSITSAEEMTNAVGAPSEADGEVQDVSDLNLAESSVVFQPLFRYRSQISQKRRIYSNRINDFS